MIPMLPRLHHTSSSSAASYYRILADHIIQNSKPILNLYANPSETSLKEKCTNIKVNTNNSCIEPMSDKDRTLYLANGYAVSSNFVQSMYILKNIKKLDKKWEKMEKSFFCFLNH